MAACEKRKKNSNRRRRFSVQLNAGFSGRSFSPFVGVLSAAAISITLASFLNGCNVMINQSLNDFVDNFSVVRALDTTVKETLTVRKLPSESPYCAVHSMPLSRLLIRFCPCRS